MKTRQRSETARPRKPPPANGQATETYEKLIAAAAEILGEAGFEKLTTNAICARAGLTPPALYRYFDDKYQVLEVIARRLFERQSAGFAAWLAGPGAWGSTGSQADRLAGWFALSARITAEQPGALWTLRAVRALPNLAHLRLEFQRANTDRLFAVYHGSLPKMDRDLLWGRLRLRSEIGWMVDELALEEDQVSPEVLFREASRLLSRALNEGRGAN